MSIAAVTDHAALARPAARPGSAYPAAPSRPYGSPVRLRPAPDPPGEQSVTVTVRVGPGGPHDRVLAALHDLIVAAGAEAVVDVESPASASAGAGVEVFPASRVVTRDGRALALSRLEYDLLLFLAENPCRVFSRAQLLSQVWGHTHANARTVDVHVSRLRTKLGENPELITTVHGIGYRLADDAVVTVVR